MADLRVETPSLSDHTEFTETKDQGAGCHASVHSYPFSEKFQNFDTSRYLLYSVYTILYLQK